jgi:hypothetical protein
MSYDNLPSRPDYKGMVTITEGIAWAKAHPGAEAHPTPENTLYLDASKLDFGNLKAEDLKLNVKVSVNLNSFGNFVQSSFNQDLRSTVYALGRVYLTLVDATGKVKVVNDEATDYDWNGGGSWMRRSLIFGEKLRAGLTDNDGFKTFYYGTGTLNPSSARSIAPELGAYDY